MKDLENQAFQWYSTIPWNWISSYRVSHNCDKIKLVRFLLKLTPKPTNQMAKSMEKWSIAHRLRREGWGYKEIAEQLQVHWSTVYRLLHMSRAPTPKKKPPSVATPHVTKQILRMAHGVKNMSTRTVVERMKEKGTRVSQSTVYRVLKRAGLTKKKNKKSFRLTNLQKAKRVKYARAHLYEHRDELVFLDETAVVATSTPNPHNDGTWLRKEEEADVTQQDKHPLKINAISAISLRGISKLHLYRSAMNSATFLCYLKKIVRELRNGPYKNHQLKLVMDSATYHRHHKVEAWMRDHDVQWVKKEEWPASSPDINPVENLWSTLQSRITSKGPTTMRSLMNLASRTWNALTLDEVAKCINALPSRYREIIRRKGAQAHH